MLIAAYPVIKWGMGISPDSVAYLSAAYNFSAGNGFILYDNSYMTNWPILYPALIGLLNFIPININTSIFIFQCIISCLSFYFVQKHLSGKYSKILLLSVFLFPPFFKLFLMVWSESLFIFLFVLAIHNFTKNKQNTATTLLYILFFSLACLTRYAGVFLVLGLLLNEFFVFRNIKKSLLLCVSLIPIGVNLLINFRYQINIVEYNLNTNPHSHLMHNTSSSVWHLLVHLVLVVAVIFGFKYFKQSKNIQLLIALIFYWLGVLLFYPLKWEELMRYALPFLPIIIWVWDTENIFIKPQIVLSGFIVSVLAFALYMYSCSQNGIGGYSKLSWQHTANQLKEVIRSNNTAIKIYSNAPDFIYFKTSKTAILVTEKAEPEEYSQLIWVNGIDRNQAILDSNIWELQDSLQTISVYKRK